MPRPLTPASLRVLSLVARYGLYLWVPSSVAVLDDPWRRTVHAGSVASLLKRGLLNATGDFEVAATAKGIAALCESVVITKLSLVEMLANTAVEITISGFDDPSDSRLAARRIFDAFRIVSHEKPEDWENVVDFVLSGREVPFLAELLAATLESVEDTSVAEQHPDVSVRMVAVGPRPR